MRCVVSRDGTTEGGVLSWPVVLVWQAAGAEWRGAGPPGGTGRAPGPNLGQATSLPRERVREFQHEAHRYMAAQQGGAVPSVAEHAPSDPMAVDSMQQGVRGMSIAENGYGRPPVAPQVPALPLLRACRHAPAVAQRPCRLPPPCTSRALFSTGMCIGTALWCMQLRCEERARASGFGRGCGASGMGRRRGGGVLTWRSARRGRAWRDLMRGRSRCSSSTTCTASCRRSSCSRHRYSSSSCSSRRFSSSSWAGLLLRRLTRPASLCLPMASKTAATCCDPTATSDRELRELRDSPSGGLCQSHLNGSEGRLPAHAAAVLRESSCHHHCQ